MTNERDNFVDKHRLSEQDCPDLLEGTAFRPGVRIVSCPNGLAASVLDEKTHPVLRGFNELMAQPFTGALLA